MCMSSVIAKHSLPCFCPSSVALTGLETFVMLNMAHVLKMPSLCLIVILNFKRFHGNNTF